MKEEEDAGEPATAAPAAAPVLDTYTNRELKHLERERSGEVQAHYVINDGSPLSGRLLIGLKNVFSKCLPNMPKEYITRLVFDRRHRRVAPGMEGFERAMPCLPALLPTCFGRLVVSVLSHGIAAGHVGFPGPVLSRDPPSTDHQDLPPCSSLQVRRHHPEQHFNHCWHHLPPISQPKVCRDRLLRRGPEPAGVGLRHTPHELDQGGGVGWVMSLRDRRVSIATPACRWAGPSAMQILVGVADPSFHVLIPPGQPHAIAILPPLPFIPCWQLHARDQDGCQYFLTYADNNAVGYFSKQGFSKTISMEKERVRGAPGWAFWWAGGIAA